MPNDSAEHVAPIVLWQCAWGGRDLPKRHYVHIIACADYEKLADEIGDTVDKIEKGLCGRHAVQTN